MGSRTTISWTDATWAPVSGCSRVSPGCERCYAEKIAGRFSGPWLPFEGLVKLTKRGARWTGKTRMNVDRLSQPLRWKRPRKIFTTSMSDVFHERNTNAEIAAIFGVMAAAPWHTFQVLTKRAKRMRAWFAWMHEQIEVDGDPWTTLMRETTTLLAGHDKAWQRYLDEHDHKEDACFEPWPLPNVWIGCSTENQATADERIPDLLNTPAAVRFLSCEPLLGAINLRRIGHGPIPICALTGGWGVPQNGGATLHHQENRVHMVIAGCESGVGARECETDWLRSLRDQCAATDAAFFLKQAEESTDLGLDGLLEAIDDDSVAFGDGSTLKARRPGGNHIIELPYLDGAQYAEFPEAR